MRHFFEKIKNIEFNVAKLKIVLYNKGMGRKKRKAEQKALEQARITEVNTELSADKKEDLPAKPQTEDVQLQVVTKDASQDILEVLRYERKQRNNLLGKFVGDEYVIPDDIRKELLLVGKKFDEFDENVIRVTTILGDFVLNFRIDLEIDPDICKAKLYFIEVEQGIEEDIKHLSLLDEMEEPNDMEFRSKVFERWHIYYEGEDFAKGDFLHQYIHMQNEEYLFQKELVAILSQLFVVRMLAYLDKMGEIGDKIRVDFKLAMEKLLEQDESFAQNFTMQKYLLVDFIVKHNAFAEIMKTDEGTKILNGYSAPIIKLRDKTYENSIEATTTAKKPTKKKTDTAKPTIKAKSVKPAKSSAKPFVLDFSKLPKTNVGGGSFGIKPATAQPQRAPVARQTPPRQVPNPRPVQQPAPQKVAQGPKPAEEMRSKEAQQEMAAGLDNITLPGDYTNNAQAVGSISVNVVPQTRVNQGKRTEDFTNKKPNTPTISK